jgi:hypothetical protein
VTFVNRELAGPISGPGLRLPNPEGGPELIENLLIQPRLVLGASLEIQQQGFNHLAPVLSLHRLLGSPATKRRNVHVNPPPVIRAQVLFEHRLDLGQIVDVLSGSIAFLITPMVFESCRERLLQRR